MPESEKLKKWQETWQSHWRTEGPPAYELTPAGEAGSADWERELLASTRTLEKDKERLDRMLKEFSTGFDRLYRLGPAVTVFGSARFGEGSARYGLGVEVGQALARAGFAVITGGGPGMMEAANRGAKEAGGVSIGCNIVLPREQKPNPYVDDVVSFNYFFTRKVMLVKYSCAFSAFRRLRDAGRDVRSGHAHPVWQDRAVSPRPDRQVFLEEPCGTHVRHAPRRRDFG
jgi:hypothetical protein